MKSKLIYTGLVLALLGASSTMAGGESKVTDSNTTSPTSKNKDVSDIIESVKSLKSEIVYKKKYKTTISKLNSLEAKYKSIQIDNNNAVADSKILVEQNQQLRNDLKKTTAAKSNKIADLESRLITLETKYDSVSSKLKIANGYKTKYNDLLAQVEELRRLIYSD